MCELFSPMLRFAFGEQGKEGRKKEEQILESLFMLQSKILSPEYSQNGAINSHFQECARGGGDGVVFPSVCYGVVLMLNGVVFISGC
jgi:hypothetical protein